MLLDLNDPQTIVNWWSVFPERHGALLADWSRRRPEHRVAISQARRLINADPARRALLERVRALDAHGSTEEAAQQPPSHDELAAGELEH
ncbi:hypothetical protein [Mitsuaria sp. 7]|uniref:hypothetical protein n=1 Tax=Mitsuaria sp. 7 TaxID=1658665 RepID=UPI0012F7C491|nr:hypothetical protein [Mitsuaria sp. 7]